MIGENFINNNDYDNCGDANSEIYHDFNRERNEKAFREQGKKGTNLRRIDKHDIRHTRFFGEGIMADIENACYHYLVNHFKKQGLMTLNTNDAGFPDLMVFDEDRLKFFVEVKQGFHLATLMQQHQFDYHDQLRELGFNVKLYFFNRQNQYIELIKRKPTNRIIPSYYIRPTKGRYKYTHKKLFPFSPTEVERNYKTSCLLSMNGKHTC